VFADGLGSNSTLLKIDLPSFALGDGGVSIIAQSLGSWITAQKLTFGTNSIIFKGIGLLLETMEQYSHHNSDIDLRHNRIGNEGTSLLVSRAILHRR
jgi:hypothetical protein